MAKMHEALLAALPPHQANLMDKAKFQVFSLLHADSSPGELAELAEAVEAIKAMLTEDAQAAHKAKQAAVKFSISAPFSYGMNETAHGLADHTCSICGGEIGFHEKHAILKHPGELAWLFCHIECVPENAMKVGIYMGVKYMVGNDPAPTA